MACGGERRFGDLVTQDRPRHMLDLGFNPIVWHALQTLEAGGVKDVLLVARGDHAASRFDAWLKEGYEGGCDVEVITAPEDADTADALRAAMPRVSADADTLAVVAGDSSPTSPSPTFSQRTCAGARWRRASSPSAARGTAWT